MNNPPKTNRPRSNAYDPETMARDINALFPPGSPPKPTATVNKRNQMPAPEKPLARRRPQVG